MRIGITETFNEDKFDQYADWLHGIDEQVDILRLSYQLGNEEQTSMVDGLLLSGGGDVHPRYYNCAGAIGQVRGVDEKRDEFEFEVIERSLRTNIPILGVCRGMQVMNVYLGGSLIPDLAPDEYSKHSTGSDEPVFHPATVLRHSMMHVLSGGDGITINSFHHQAVNELGKGLIPSAISPDQVVEAAEWAIKDTMPFLLLVQWHPERMTEDFLSQKIARMFLREANNFHFNRININDN
jgi:putative glutamine amidotransferase